MDNNEFEKETVVSGTDVTPDMTENVTEEVQAEETIASVEIEEPKAEVKSPVAEVTPVKKKSKSLKHRKRKCSLIILTQSMP